MVGDEELTSGISMAAESLRKGVEMDAVLADLRSRGFAPMDCIRAVMATTEATLPEAMRIVHFSSAWPELTR